MVCQVHKVLEQRFNLDGSSMPRSRDQSDAALSKDHEISPIYCQSVANLCSEAIKVPSLPRLPPIPCLNFFPQRSASFLIQRFVSPGNASSVARLSLLFSSQAHPRNPMKKNGSLVFLCFMFSFNTIHFIRVLSVWEDHLG